jgi:hypothetical protein
MADCSYSSAMAYENCAAPPQGLYPYPGLPGLPQDIDRQYAVVALRNKPSSAPAGFAVLAEACLRARGILYHKSVPGDCGRAAAPSGITSGQIVGLSGMAASGVVGGLSAAGVLAGPATLGISSAVSLAVAGIEDVFQHHAQAVANEQSTICSMAAYFNGVCPQIDQAVLSGAITYDQGVTFMRQVTQQAISGLQSIYKPCNAACVYQGVLRAHADFVSYLYPRISPIWQGAQAPASAPVTPNNPPGAVPDAGAGAPLRSSSDPNFAYMPAIVTAAPNIVPNKVLPSGCVTCSDYLNMGYNQQSGQSAQAADVPPSGGINWVMLGAIAAVVAAFVAVVAVVK